MAILVREKKEGVRVADCLLQYKQMHPESPYRYDLISDEALYVKNASSVKLIVAILRHLQRPNDSYLHKLALMEYAVFLKQGMVGQESVSVGDLLINDTVDFSEEIRAALVDVRKMPLYEMCERLVALFQTRDNRADAIYLQAFQDMVLDFSTRKTADLMAFLLWWEESGVKKTISTPDTQDAIRIMTIHKSKGLGFKAVLMPFCDWAIDQKPSSTLWCQPAVAPFDEIPVLPVAYTKSLAESIFAFDYYYEKIHAYIDNLNVAYVAFTRAKEELIAFLPKAGNVLSLSGLLAKCIEAPLVPQDGRSYIHLPDYFDNETAQYNDEIAGPVEMKEAKSKANTLVPRYVSVNPDGRLQMKLRNRSFFAKEKERQYGNLMHDILSRVLTLDDIEQAIEESVFAGEITHAEGVEMAGKLNGLIVGSRVEPWFGAGVKVLNEVQILQPDGLFLRPDRVVIREDEVMVIDFKFGQLQSPGYIRQVSGYVGLIRKMGYSNVRGLIWYVEANEFVEV
jgi:ATP-dependent exoDNAse (exonuclease V) beta subunit